MRFTVDIPDKLLSLKYIMTINVVGLTIKRVR